MGICSSVPRDLILSPVLVFMVSGIHQTVIIIRDGPVKEEEVVVVVIIWYLQGIR